MPYTPNSNSAPRLLERLTPRERECLRLVAQHLSSKEIARQLGLSQHTVDGHLHEARRKLGVPTRRDAVRILLESEGGESPPANWGGQSAAPFPPVAPPGETPPPPPIGVPPDLSGGQSSGVAAGAPLSSARPSPGRKEDDHDRRRLFRHELNPPERLAAIVVIAAVSALVLLLLLLGTHELTFLIQRMTEGG